MDRRELILGAVGTIAATGALSQVLAAGTALAATPATKLVETSTHCITTGLACLAHCQQELAKGNKAMADCQASVTDMLAACQALQNLAGRGSPHTATLAKACAQICADCAKTCETHQTMAVCKSCMDACKACEQACQAA